MGAIRTAVFIAFVLQWANANPIAVVSSESGGNFEDHWDYKIEPHDDPLLEEARRSHELPPVPEKDTSKETTNSSTADRRSRQRLSKKIASAVRSRISCSTCKLGVGLLQKAVLKGDSFSSIKERFVAICVGFGIQTEGVCTGIFDVFAPELLPVLNVTRIGPVEICGLVLGETCGLVENPLHEWSIDFPGVAKPDVVEPPLPKPGAPTFKVLHLSDTHLDPEYAEGSPAVCEEPLCCRQYSSPSSEGPQKSAGKWGSYGSCDSPRVLIKNMLKNIVEQHPDIDYIIWTGDLPPHDIWNQTKKSNTENIRETVMEIVEAFPNIPIFPAIGNHESVPAGSFAPPWMEQPDHSIDWLYQEVIDHWSKWLPSSINNTLVHGAFYSVLVRPGFRIISLNTNYCHSLSWWLLVNSTDPASELKWLVHELQRAEDKGEKVHIIGHIPPGASDCMKVWSRNYYEIVERYEDTITAQFYGHTHADEFEMFYDTGESRRPTSVAYIGPSVTTYENNNPAYRIYYVDGDHEDTTREVIDHETWTFNLEEANKNPQQGPKWFKLYSARAAYGLESLRPKEWGKLLEEMVDDDKLFQLFYKYYYRDSPTRPDCTDNKCILQILCDLRSGKSHDRHNLCHDLELIF